MKVLLVGGLVVAVPVIVVLLLVVTIFVPLAGPLGPSFAPGAGNTTVVNMALSMAAHLHCQATPGPLDCNDPHLAIPEDRWYDQEFPGRVLQWAAQHCPGCGAWRNGNFQCVPFVIAAYAFSTPLPVGNENADHYWSHFAHLPGWQEIPSGGIPAPGDIMAWAGGEAGHVSIVIAVGAHSITFAQANGERPIQTLPLKPDRSVDTHGYWGHFLVLGYIRPVPHLPVGMPDSPYVQEAWGDAVETGIPPALFVRQINLESGFNPRALSPAGAQGIAQILPQTAQGWGIDPWDPHAALRAAAQHMARYQIQYAGDISKALAAYNAGQETVDQAIMQCHLAWLTCLPTETEHYVQTITSPE